MSSITVFSRKLLRVVVKIYYHKIVQYLIIYTISAYLAMLGGVEWAGGRSAYEQGKSAGNVVNYNISSILCTIVGQN